ncbi:MAG: hypothetical protein KAV82_02575 [Phycisphaerae bacterium]|nr:hypothetical protein [Phycisphaerae bacterium]
MAITPIHPARISLHFQSQRLLETLRRNQLNTFAQQSRLASGRRFVTAGDDPLSANQAIKLTELRDRQEQLYANIMHAGNVLDATDNALGDVNRMLSDAHGIASQSAGSLALPDERAAAAELIASIRDGLVTIGNRQFGERHLFAGRDTTGQPFQHLLGGIAYLGDRGDVMVQVTDLDFESINVTGDAIFGALAQRISGAVDLDPVVTTGTRLDDLAGATGHGIRKGVLVFNEPNGAGVVQVDLNSADTLGDIVGLINTTATDAGAGFTADLTPTGLTIVPGGDLSITGVIAEDLGIKTYPEAAAAIVGADLNLRLTRTTLLSDLAGGVGLDLSEPILITNGNESKSIDLSDAQSIQDICNTINNAGVSVKAEINAAGTGIDVINLICGMRMSITENGGTTAADLGIRSVTESTSLLSLNYGKALETQAGEGDLRIVAKDGTWLNVNLDEAGTLGDVIDLINQAADDTGVSLTASLTDSGDGWKIEDGTGGAGALSIYPLNPENYAKALGLHWSAAADPADTELVLNDLSTGTNDSVMAVLFDLERALLNDDTGGITEAGSRLNGLMEDITRNRGIIGARAKAMQDRLTQMENANFASEVLLSQVQDLDYAEAATLFEEARTALQASLTVGSQVMSISLLDFLR